MKENPTEADIIAYNLGRLLDQRGLNQLEFAKAIGENRTTVNNWCKGKALPRFPKFAKMAAVLGCSVSDITELNANNQDQHLIPFKRCNMTLGEKIKHFREENHLTQAELGQKVSASAAVVASWEKGRTEPNLAQSAKLCRLLDCSLDALIGPDPISPGSASMDDSVVTEWQESLLLYISKYCSMNESKRKQVNSYIDFLLSQGKGTSSQK